MSIDDLLNDCVAPPATPAKENIEGTLPKKAPLSSLVTWKVDEKNSNIEFWNEFHKVKWVHQSTLNSQQIGHKASDFFKKKKLSTSFHPFWEAMLKPFTSQQVNKKTSNQHWQFQVF